MPASFAEPINAATRFCAVYGHPVRHSASPALQNAGLAALGLNWRYLAFDVHPPALPEAIAGARAMHFVGLNLTVPHKLLAVDLVDEMDAAAREWGAVNTIRFEAQDQQGGWRPLAEVDAPAGQRIRAHGFNTDAAAIIRSLREDVGVSVPGAQVLLLGAGGAGRVAALKLAAEGAARLYLVNRTASKAEAIAAEIGARFPAVEVAVDYPRGPVDLVLNATSVGLRKADGLPFDPGRFSLSQASAVYDMVYGAAETPLVRAAREAGCRAANGAGMLLYQGTAALEIWTGRPAPVDEMRRALHQHLYG